MRLATDACTENTNFPCTNNIPAITLADPLQKTIMGLAVPQGRAANEERSTYLEAVVHATRWLRLHEQRCR